MLSRSVVSDSSQTHGLYSPWNSPGQNTGVGSLSLLQGIFPTQRQNPVLPHCKWIWIPYQLSHQGNPSHQGSIMLICFSSTASNPSPSFAAAAAKSLQLWSTPCDPTDGSPPTCLENPRQEYWSGLPFPSPMHERKSESEVAVVSDS